MLPISIILVSAEVGQARLRVKPGDDSREMGRLIFIPLSLNPSQSV
jgi:hypothetical protein